MELSEGIAQGKRLLPHNMFTGDGREHQQDWIDEFLADEFGIEPEEDDDE